MTTTRPTTRSTSDSEAAAFEFLDTAAALERRLDRTLGAIRGISFSEYRLLLALSPSAAGLPRIELATAVDLTASAVTRALKPLEKLGYVTTQRSQRDARQSLASITPGGRELLDDARGVVADVLAELPVEALTGRALKAFRARLDQSRRNR